MRVDDKFLEAMRVIYAILIIIVGILQGLSGLYMSGFLMFVSAIIIVSMAKDIRNVKKGRKEKRGSK